MAIDATSHTYHLSGPGEVSLTGYRDPDNGVSDGSVTLAIHGVGFFPSLDDQDRSVRVALGSDVASLIASHLAEFAAGHVPAKNAYFTEQFGTTQLTSPDSDSNPEDDIDDPDPELLEDWTTLPDPEGDVARVSRSSWSEGHISILEVNDEVVFLTPEAVEGLILRLSAHLDAHRAEEKRRQREEAELSEARGKWTGVLFPGYIYATAPLEYQRIVDRAVEFERTGERELPF